MARGRGRGRGDWSVGTPGGVQEVTYTVPADKCGLVIGKGKPCCGGLALPLWLLGLKADRPHVQFLRSTRFTPFSTLDQRGQAQGCRCLQGTSLPGPSHEQARRVLHHRVETDVR